MLFVLIVARYNELSPLNVQDGLIKTDNTLETGRQPIGFNTSGLMNGAYPGDGIVYGRVISCPIIKDVDMRKVESCELNVHVPLPLYTFSPMPLVTWPTSPVRLYTRYSQLAPFIVVDVMFLPYAYIFEPALALTMQIQPLGNDIVAPSEAQPDE